jgi:hypothetical protein
MNRRWATLYAAPGKKAIDDTRFDCGGLAESYTLDDTP